VILIFLVWVLLGATLALAGVIVAYIERRHWAGSRRSLL